MTVRPMRPGELKKVLDWAAAEGWNPGLDDAEAFFASDPEGFWVKEVDGQMVAAVSVVNHDDHNAFLGLYLCATEFRGKGYGFEVWNKALKHAGKRSIGLDGVPAQVDNYARSGFQKFGRTIRYAGQVEPLQASKVTLATPENIESLLRLDHIVFGHARPNFLKKWFSPGPTRKTHLIRRNSDIVAAVTARQCLEGQKLGPFYAHTTEDARALLSAVEIHGSGGTVYVDVPDSAQMFCNLLTELGFEPVFETARMYTGKRPKASPPPFVGIATMELG